MANRTAEMERKTPAKPRKAKPKAVRVVLPLLLTLAVGAGVGSYLHGLGKETTDDAQVEGHVASVAPRIAGQVLRVRVTDNQVVAAGDVLVELDDRDQQVKLTSARADLAAAQATLAAAETQRTLTEKTVEANLQLGFQADARSYELVLPMLGGSPSVWNTSMVFFQAALLVGYAVGGPSDTIARIMADRMKVTLGQPVIIENVTGAAGSIAVARGARSPHDGYTIVMGDWSTHVVNAAMYDLQYDVVKDFEPVSLLPSAPQIIASPNSVPAKNLKDLIAWIKADPTKVAYGMSGLGSPSHVSGVLLQNVTGAKFQLVPYRGAALVMNDLLAGTLQLSMFPVTVALPQLRAGGVRAYAITAGQRSVGPPVRPARRASGRAK